MEHYGWSLIDSNGVTASSLIFQNRKAADQLRAELSELRPERECALIELFVKSRLD